MDAVTYPNVTGANYLNSRVIPLRLGHKDQPHAESFLVKWTPRLCLLDTEGNVHHQGMGFFPPDELVPFVHLGIAKNAFDKDQLEEAARVLEELLQDTPASGSAPEAVYLRGVSRFKKDHDKSHLKEVYRILQFDYPGSSWARRGFPYWNL